MRGFSDLHEACTAQEFKPLRCGHLEVCYEEVTAAAEANASINALANVLRRSGRIVESLQSDTLQLARVHQELAEAFIALCGQNIARASAVDTLTADRAVAEPTAPRTLRINERLDATDSLAEPAIIAFPQVRMDFDISRFPQAFGWEASSDSWHSRRERHDGHGRETDAHRGVRASAGEP